MVELEVDRVVAVAIDPGIVVHDRLSVVAVVSVLDTVVAKDALVADGIAGTRTVAGTAVETTEQ